MARTYDDLEPTVPKTGERSDTPNDAEQVSATTKRQKSKLTPEDTIVARLKAGRLWMSSHVSRSINNAAKYLDSSSESAIFGISTRAEHKPLTAPVGEVNAIAMNIRHKVASMTTAYPDFFPEVSDSVPPELAKDAAPLVKDWLSKWDRYRDHSRVFRKAALERFVGGIGVVAYLWDDEQGPVLEYVKPQDFIIDPLITDDNWNNPRWGARRVRLPIPYAEELYGRENLTFGLTNYDGLVTTDPTSWYDETGREGSSCEIWIYYDGTTEAYVSGEKVLLRTENLYGRVPMKCYCGSPNPQGEFPLSDYDTSQGVFEMYRRLTNIVNSVAKNGGGIPWARSEFIDEAQMHNLAAGDFNSILTIKGVSGEQALGFTQNQALNPSVLEALKLMRDALDRDTGIDPTQNPNFGEGGGKSATQSALIAASGGANNYLERMCYERFVEGIYNDCLWMQREFGLAALAGSDDEEAILAEQILHAALHAVNYVKIVDNSTEYRGPLEKQQEAGQLFQIGVQSFELLNQLGTAPNLPELWKMLLRSHNIRNVDEYTLQTGGIQQANQAIEQQEQEQEQQVPTQQPIG